MRDTPRWTISLGTWDHTHLRLHAAFPLAVACTLYWSWLAGQLDPAIPMGRTAALAVVLLTPSVLFHIVGHVYAAARLGLGYDRIVIGPHGDFADDSTPTDIATRLRISLAGPAANLLAALICLPGLAAFGSQHILGSLNPLSPPTLASASLSLAALKLAFWINWSMAIINLLPAAPFDGLSWMQTLVHRFRPFAGRRRYEQLQTQIAIATGLSLLLLAWLVRNTGDASLLPSWFPLLLVAVVVVFAATRTPHRPAQRELRDNEFFGYDFSEGYTSLERSAAVTEETHDEDGPLERWLDTRRHARRVRQQQLEAEEDQRVDEILARVHHQGLEALSEEERQLLHRVSMRYRTRTD